MEIKYKFLFIVLFLSIYSCNTSEVDSATTTYESLTDSRITLGLFWKTFQTAVADRDIETLESLYAPSVRAHKFVDKEYQEKIAAGNASDITSGNETFKDKKVYAFTMVFPPETITDDGENEESTTTIYIWQNDNKEFEIFNVLEAG